MTRVSLDFSRMPAWRGAVRNAVNAGVTAAAARGASFMRTGMSTGPRWSGSVPGSPPNVQRGGLRNSIFHTASVNFRASAGSNAPYALVHERGGTIFPKNVKYLPIPANIAARRLLEKLGGRSLRAEDMNFIPGRNGKPPMLIGHKRVRAVRYLRGGWRKDVGGEPVFVLKKSLTLKARPWCLPAVRKNISAIGRDANAAARRLLRAFARSSASLGGVR